MRATLILAILLACAHAVGCGSQGEELPWFVEEDGRFVTTDVARAEKEVPFSIVLPGYLPSNLSEDPWLVGYLTEARPDNRATVEADYYAEGGVENGLMWVHQSNYQRLVPDPAATPRLVEVGVAGVEIVEWREELGWLASRGPINTPGFVFMWSDNGVYFEVAIYGQDHSEALKVVESMIQR